MEMENFTSNNEALRLFDWRTASIEEIESELNSLANLADSIENFKERIREEWEGADVILSQIEFTEGGDQIGISLYYPDSEDDGLITAYIKK